MSFYDFMIFSPSVTCVIQFFFLFFFLFVCFSEFIYLFLLDRVRCFSALESFSQ